VIYDPGVTLVETWHALERLVDDGKCRSIGLSDITWRSCEEVVAAARIKPAVVQVESHPYLPEWELLDFCRQHGIVLLAFAPLGHGSRTENNRRSGDNAHRPARREDPGAGCAGLGRAARHGFPDDLDLA
jgi:diketogulonate reductase-like aldo/keto reductase